MYPELIYSTPFFASAVSILIVGLFIYSQPRRPMGFWYLVFICFSAAFWSGTEGVLYLGFPTEINMRITYIQHLGIVPLAPLTLLFVVTFFGFNPRLKPNHILGLAIVAAANLALIWTDPIHHLFYSRHYTIHTGPVPMLGLYHALVWWFVTGYHYMLMVMTCIFLVRIFATTTGPLRVHAAMVFCLLCVVFAFNAVYITGNSPVSNMDIGPLAFILVAAAMAGGFYRFNLLDIHPIGRTTFFNALENPILVLDTKKRLLDLNPSAERTFALRGGDAIGKHIVDLFPDQPLLTGKMDPATPLSEALPIFSGDAFRYYELHISMLKNKNGLTIGLIYTFHDITEQKHAEEAMRDSLRLQGVLEIAHTVCQDMQPPLDVIRKCSQRVLADLPIDHPERSRGVNLAGQVKRLEKTARKLMGITRYKTRGYLEGRIIDIDSASSTSDALETTHNDI